MDGFSAAANVITVLQAANAVISLCYDFKAALQKTPWALTRTLEEVTDLRNTMENVERIYTSSSAEASVTTPGHDILHITRKSCTDTLSTCLSALNHLEGLLGAKLPRNDKGSRWQAVGQAVTWRFKDREIFDILERVQRCKSTLSLAMAIDEW